MKTTDISWTTSTFNPWWGCEKVSPGCKNCYADAFSARLGLKLWGPGSTRRQFKLDHWKQPLHWDDAAKKSGQPHRVFCGSMCDVFEDHPIANEERERLWSLIHLTPHLTWQLLTKRADRIRQGLPDTWGMGGYENVWIGVSAENQEWWDKRVPLLVKIPCMTLFVSAEPLIGPIRPGPEIRSVNWLIIGGESGSKRRPCSPDWISELAFIADTSGTAVWVKQDSALKPGQQGRIPDDIWKMKRFPKL